MATLIRTDGKIREVHPARGAAGFSLQELQTFVGGYVEALRAPDGRLMFLNEDGKRLQLPINATATHLMRNILRPDDLIVGDVVVCDAVEAGEGDPEEDAEDLDAP